MTGSAALKARRQESSEAPLWEIQVLPLFVLFMWRHFVKSDRIMLSEWMIVNNELEKMWNTVMAHFEVLYRNISGGTEKILTNIRMTHVPITIRTGSLLIKVTNLTSWCQFARRIWTGYKIHKERISKQVINWCVKRL